MQVNQFHSGTATGDAITNEMLFWREHLRAAGFDSEVFAQHIPDELRSEIRDIRVYRPEPGSVLLLHHSMGHDILASVIDHPHRIVTVYHNITPLNFIDVPELRSYARLGHEMLFELAQHSTAAIADSNFNRIDMLKAGFANARVIPVRTDFGSLRPIDSSPPRSFDWLFVGRLFPSKGQLELVDAFADSLQHHDHGGHLVLVGDTSHAGYLADVELQASRRDVLSRLRITGKVSDEQLAEEYRRAGLFVSMSKHEGFGVPLLEAMASGLPVVAYRSAAIAETMGGAGILVTAGDSAQFVGSCVALMTDQTLASSTVQRQFERIRQLESFDVREALEATVAEATATQRRLQVQVQGPFETSYSLAVLNRQLSLALDSTSNFDVSIYATEGPGDYEPRPADLAAHPEATALYRKSAKVPNPDVVIRQMYPPRVADSPGGLTFQYFGWEESRLPQEYVTSFNAHLDGIGAMSTYVKTLLEESGVTVPTTVVGVGVRRPSVEDAPPLEELTDARGFRFVHISSAFPRKGVDLLLHAYFDRFTGDDDVTLIVKTFPNPHNDVERLLAEAVESHHNPPHVIWIDRDMTASELDAIYAEAHVLVHPARGEGFGLPVAEAMLARVPVIAPDSTGLADFVNDRTALVVPSRPVLAATHLSVAGSLWQEPDVQVLGERMREIHDGRWSPEVLSRVDAAEKLITDEFNWEAVSRRWAATIQRAHSRRVAPHVAMVSTWNTRCGIAEYTSDLVTSAGADWRVEIYANKGDASVDPIREEGISRNWIASPQTEVDDLIADLERSAAQIVHIQHNFGFVGLSQLAQTIRRLAPTRPVVVTLHRTEDLVSPNLVVHLEEIAADLALAHRIVVHQHDDAHRLRSWGLDRVTVVPIGSAEPLELSTTIARKALGLLPDLDLPVVASYGFLLPHKGTLELIRAAAVLRDRGHEIALLAVCAIHPDPTSAAYERQCTDEIARLRLGSTVRLVTDFLDPDVSRLLLAAADVIALPYHETSESSSASLRFVLPIGRPVVATDIAIFADARGSLVSVEAPPTPETLATVIADLIEDPAKRQHYAELSRRLATRSSLSRSVAAHTELYHDLLRHGVPQSAGAPPAEADVN